MRHFTQASNSLLACLTLLPIDLKTFAHLLIKKKQCYDAGFSTRTPDNCLDDCVTTFLKTN